MTQLLQYYGHIEQPTGETNQTPFKMVYGQEVVVLLHFRQHTVEIAKALKLDIEEAKHERLF